MVVFLLNYCLVCMHFCIFRQLQALTVHSSYCDSHWMLQWLHLMNQFLHTHMICIWSPRCRKARLSLWLVLNFLYHTQSLTNINTWDFVLLCFFFSGWNNIFPPPHQLHSISVVQSCFLGAGAVYRLAYVCSLAEAEVSS